MVVDNRLGEMLRGARQRANRSLEDYARQLGKSREALSQWEQGARRPSRRLLRKVAEVYMLPYEVITEVYLAAMRRSLEEPAP